MADWSRARRMLDPLLAAALLLAGQYALWRLPAEESGFVGPRPLDAAFLVLVSVPLAWRSRAPQRVFAVVLGSAWLWLLLLYGQQPQPPFAPAVALWLATFSAAAASRGRTAAVVATALAAMLVSTDVPALLDGRPWGNVVPSWVVFALTFAVGRTVGRRQQQATALAERAAELEAGREQEARRAVGTERARIARELHDVITHAVTGIVVQAAAEARALPTSTSTREVLHDIETTGREALIELRRLLGVLRKPDEAGDLQPQPTLRELDGLLDAARSAGLEVRVDIRGQPSTLPASVDLSAFRIVQEALTNVRKHGDGGPADLTLRYCPDALVLEVVNPREPATAPSSPGFGLVGLRERVDLHGGMLEAGPDTDGQFRLRARLPYRRDTG